LHHLFCFCKFFWENIFKVFFANSQRYMNKIARSIFKIWNFSPCFKCFSFDLTKLPLNEILLLVFKRVLVDTNWKYIEMLVFEKLIPVENIIPIWSISITRYQLKTKISKFLGDGAVLLLWANTLSPFGINRQKRRLCEPFLLSPHLYKKIWVKDYTNWRVMWSDSEG
jgi:hypothetical protein